MILDITKPMALDETLQATNTELGNIESDIETIGTNLSTLDSTADEIAKDTTLQATNTAVGNVNTTLGTQNGKLDTMNTKLQAIVDALGSQSLIGDTDISGIADGTITGAIAQFDGDISDLDTDKADKVDSATNGNLAGLDSSGNLTDSGISGDTTTTSASGNPLSISNLKSDQLAVNPVITLEPIQAGSGTPSPSNIRAISGYDKIEVLSCGRNLIEGKLTGYTITSSGNVYASAGNDLQYAKVVKGATYTISEQSQYVYGFFTEEPTTTSTSYNGERVVESNYSFTAPISGYVAVRTATGASAQIEAGSTQHTIEPYHKATSISESLGQTVYGGSLDVRTGVFTVDRAIYKVNASDIIFNSSNYVMTTSATSFKTIINDEVDYYISTHLKSHINSSVATMNNEFTVNSNKQIVIRMPNTITTDTQATDYFTNNDVYIVALLATPFTIQLTPHEISLLKDYAYVSTNGTNIALDYHNGEMASLGDVAKVGETLNKLGFNFEIFEVPIAGEELTNTYKNMYTSIDINSYTPIALIEQNPWDEKCTFTLAYTNKAVISIHIRCTETNHTIPSNAGALLIVCIPNEKVLNPIK